jgi:hypothetical protein
LGVGAVGKTMPRPSILFSMWMMRRPPPDVATPHVQLGIREMAVARDTIGRSRVLALVVNMFDERDEVAFLNDE